MSPPNVDLGGGALQPFILVLRLVMEINFLAHLVIRHDFILAVREMRGSSSEIVAAGKVVLSLREASVVIAGGDGLGTAEGVQRVKVFEVVAIFLIEVATVYPLLAEGLDPVTLAISCAIVKNAWSVAGAFVGRGDVSDSLLVLAALQSPTSEA